MTNNKNKDLDINSADPEGKLMYTKDDLEKFIEFYRNSDPYSIPIRDITYFFKFINKCDPSLITPDIISVGTRCVSSIGRSINSSVFTSIISNLGNLKHIPEVSSLINTIKNKFRYSNGKLRADEIIGCLSSLEGLSSLDFNREILIILDRYISKIMTTSLDTDELSEIKKLRSMIDGDQNHEVKDIITSKVESLLSILNSKDGIEDNQLISAARKINSVKITNAEISSILFSFRNLDSYVLRRGVIDVMAKKIDEADGKMSGKELVDSISGLRNLDSTVVSRALMNSLAKKINESDTDFNAKGISTMMHSLRNLDSLAVTHKFTESMYGKLRSVTSKLDTIQISKCFTGIGNLSPTVISEPFIKTVLDDTIHRLNDFDERGISIILHSLINYSGVNGVSEIEKRLFHHLEYKWSKGDKVEAPRLGVQIYNLYGRLIPIDLENAYEDFVNHDKIVKSKAERRAVEIVRNVTSGMYIEENKYVSGFEMDIFLPRHRLNIEVDGPEHYSKKSMDLKRDRHLLEAKMITVQRVNLLQEDIRDRVMEILNFSKIRTKQTK